jgi:hypothetical protein
MTRDVSIDEFTWLLQRATAPNDWTGPPQIVRAAAQAGVAKRYGAPIHELVAEIQAHRYGWFRPESLIPPFDQIIAAAHDADGVDLSKEALNQLRADPAGGSAMFAMFYLRDRLQLREDYEALLQINVTDGLRPIHELTIAQIQKRLGFAGSVKQ